MRVVLSRACFQSWKAVVLAAAVLSSLLPGAWAQQKAAPMDLGGRPAIVFLLGSTMAEQHLSEALDQAAEVGDWFVGAGVHVLALYEGTIPEKKLAQWNDIYPITPGRHAKKWDNAEVPSVIFVGKGGTIRQTIPGNFQPTSRPAWLNKTVLEMARFHTRTEPVYLEPPLRVTARELAEGMRDVSPAPWRFQRRKLVVTGVAGPVKKGSSGGPESFAFVDADLQCRLLDSAPTYKRDSAFALEHWPQALRENDPVTVAGRLVDGVLAGRPILPIPASEGIAADEAAKLSEEFVAGEVVTGKVTGAMLNDVCKILTLRTRPEEFETGLNKRRRLTPREQDERRALLALFDPVENAPEAISIEPGDLIIGDTYMHRNGEEAVRGVVIAVREYSYATMMLKGYRHMEGDGEKPARTEEAMEMSMSMIPGSTRVTRPGCLYLRPRPAALREYLRQAAATPRSSVAPAKESGKAPADKLRALKKLLEEGLITEEDYEKQKVRILEAL